jgi:peptidyl-prolyl cis-trans isomerase SurA
MTTQRINQSATTGIRMRYACIGAFMVLLLPAAWGQDKDQSVQGEGATTIDRVVAVVNRQSILESDLKDEMQLSVLDPSTIGQQKMTEQMALDRLISRTLIQQQIRQEDLQETRPKPDEIAARVEEMRSELPACVRADCKSDAGWKTFLARHDLTPERVESYTGTRLEILSFIELRFRQGIRISPEEIEKYYRETLSPEYPPGQKPPPLEQVSSRIEELLLEKQVNVLFDNWLANLRKQGQIEVLDPALETSEIEGATRE